MTVRDPIAAAIVVLMLALIVFDQPPPPAPARPARTADCERVGFERPGATHPYVELTVCLD